MGRVFVQLSEVKVTRVLFLIFSDEKENNETAT